MTWRRFSAEKNVDAWAGGNIPIGLWLAKSFLIATSLLAALITSFLLAGCLPERVPTDLKIVGYPAFAGFSVEHNVLLYLFFISFVPLTTLLAYSLFLKIIDLSRLNFSVINARIIGGKSHNRDFGEAASSSLVVTTS